MLLPPGPANYANQALNVGQPVLNPNQDAFQPGNVQSAMLVPPQGGTFGVLDFARRLMAKFPNPWVSAAAQADSGTPATNGLFAGIMVGAGYGLAVLWQLAVYALLQTRLLTATDVFLDLAYYDFFGTFLDRFPGETDASFRYRLRATFTLPRSRLSTIAYICQQYFAALNATIAPEVLGLDTPQEGYVDSSYGSLDQAVNAYQIGVRVFDAASDPVSAARYGIAPPEFCILLTYPNQASTDFYFDNNFFDNDFWTSGNFQMLGTPPYPYLDSLIQQLKAYGTKQVYVANTTS